MELLSIIVPVYNSEKFLPRCLNSILLQNYHNFEAILVDDGSTDSSAEICKEFVEKDKRFQYYYKKNGGVASARNFALNKMSTGGGYIAFVDNDDFIDPNMYTTLIKKLNDQHVDLCACNYIKFYENKKLEYINSSIVKTDICLSRKDAWHALSIVNKEFQMTTYLWDKLFRKELFAELILREGSNWDDAFAIHAILEKCNRILLTTDYLYYYYIRGDSTSHSISGLLDLDIVEDRYVKAQYLLKYGFENDAVICLYAAMRHLVRINKGINQNHIKSITTSRRIQSLRKDILRFYKIIPTRFVKFEYKISFIIFKFNMNFYSFIYEMIKKA